MGKPRNILSNKVAAGGAAAVLACALGAGTLALAQGDAAFDPSKYLDSAFDASAVEQSGTSSYQANPSDTDAEANRQDDGADKKDDKTVDENQLVIEEDSGTTALNVTSDDTPSTNVTVATSTASNDTTSTSNDDGETTVVVGPVVDNSGDASSAGSDSTPSGTADNGDSGGGSDGSGGSDGDPSGGDSGDSGGGDADSGDSGEGDEPDDPADDDGGYTPPAGTYLTGLTVAGSFGWVLPQGGTLTEGMFSGVLVKATFSDGTVETVPYSSYKNSVDAPLSESGVHYATVSYSWGGTTVTAETKIPYYVASYQVVLETDGIVVNGAEATVDDGPWRLEPTGSDLTVNLARSIDRMHTCLRDQGLYLVDSEDNTLSGVIFGGWAEPGETTAASTLYQIDPVAFDASRADDAAYLQSVEDACTTTLHPLTQDLSPDFKVKLLNTSLALVDYLGTDEVMDVPSGVTMISFADFGSDESAPTAKIRVVKVPATLMYIFDSNLSDATKERLSNLQAYVVDDGNETFFSMDDYDESKHDAQAGTYDGDVYGFLYRETSAGVELYRAPFGATDMSKLEYWPAKCSSIFTETGAGNAFTGTAVKVVDLPYTITSFGEDFLAESNVETVIVEASRPTFASYALTAGRTWIFKSKTPFSIGSLAAADDMTLVVPDSDNDEVFKDYLVLWGARIHAKSTSAAVTLYTADMTGSVQEILDSYAQSETAGKYRYDLDNDMVLTADGTTVERVSMTAEAAYALPAAVTVDGEEVAVTGIGANALSCSPDVGILTLPASVANIAANAFAGADGLVGLVLESETPPAIHDKMFGETLPDNLCVQVPENSLQAYLDAWTDQLDADYGEGTAERILGTTMDYLIEDGVTYRVTYDDEGAVASMVAVRVDASVVTATLKEGTTTIAAGCFANASSLEMLVLPSSLQTVEAGAFSGCTALKVLACNALSAPAFAGDAFDGITDRSLRMLTPTGSDYSSWEDALLAQGRSFSQPGASYAIVATGGNPALYADTPVDDGTSWRIAVYVSDAASGTLSFANGAPNELGPGLLAGKGVTGVTVGTTVTKVDDGAFAGCTTLATVNISGAVADWGAGLFEGCSALKTINIYAGISIPDYFATGNTSLATVKIANSNGHIYSIGAHAFEGCTNLVDFTFYSSARTNDLVSIGDYAFAGCSSLTPGNTTKTFGGNSASAFTHLETIGAHAFEGCANMTIFRANALTELGEAAFKDCTSLTWFYTAGKLEAIPDRAFQGCTSLTTCRWLQNSDGNYYYGLLKSIGDYAFQGCASLAPGNYSNDLGGTGFTGLESIGEGAFEGCTAFYADAAYGFRILPALSHVGANAFAGTGVTYLNVRPGATLTREMAEHIFGGSSVTTVWWYSTTAPAQGLFSGLSGLRAFYLYENVGQIPAQCFSGSGLEKFFAASELDGIGDEAFAGCALDEMSFAGQTAPALGSKVFGDALPTGLGTVAVPSPADYYDTWKPQLDADYGAGTTAALLGIEEEPASPSEDEGKTEAKSGESNEEESQTSTLSAKTKEAESEDKSDEVEDNLGNITLDGTYGSSLKTECSAGNVTVNGKQQKSSD